MPNPHKPEVPSTAQRRIIDFESSCAQSDNTETHARLYRGSGIFSHIGDFTCRSGRPLAFDLAGFLGMVPPGNRDGPKNAY